MYSSPELRFLAAASKDDDGDHEVSDEPDRRIQSVEEAIEEIRKTGKALMESHIVKQ